MQKYCVENHAASLLPSGTKWRLVWADEFDGPCLDTTKWTARTHMMGKRAPHFVEDAISFDGNSNICFHLELRNGVYCTTQLETGYNFMDGEGESYDVTAAEGKSIVPASKNMYTWPIGEIKEPKFSHRYGYYECRCKMQQKPGWWSAFWLQSPTIGCSLNPETAGVEVDIMEQFRRDNFVQCNNHWNGYGSQHSSTGAHRFEMDKTEDDYHYFGVHWEENGYHYYVDGKHVMNFDKPVSKIDEFILLTTEAVGYRSAAWTAWEALEGSDGDMWVVDHVRVFDADEEPK